MLPDEHAAGGSESAQRPRSRLLQKTGKRICRRGMLNTCVEETKHCSIRCEATSVPIMIGAVTSDGESVAATDCAIRNRPPTAAGCYDSLTVRMEEGRNGEPLKATLDVIDFGCLPSPSPIHALPPEAIFDVGLQLGAMLPSKTSQLPFSIIACIKVKHHFAPFRAFWMYESIL